MIDRVLQEATAKGFLLNNLFQIHQTLWKASFRNDTHGFEWGISPFPDEAIQLALRYAELGHGGLLLTSGAFINRNIIEPRPSRHSADKLLDLI